MARLYAGTRMCCIARMADPLVTLWEDLSHVTVETRVTDIIGVDAPEECRPALSTELDLASGSLRHTRQAAFLLGPVVEIHQATEAVAESVRRQWPRLLQRFAHLDAQADALTDGAPDETPEEFP